MCTEHTHSAGWEGDVRAAAGAVTGICLTPGLSPSCVSASRVSLIIDSVCMCCVLGGTVFYDAFLKQLLGSPCTDLTIPDLNTFRSSVYCYWLRKLVFHKAMFS